MTITKEDRAQVRKSVFTCSSCHSQLNYVQLLTNEHVESDFFECPICNIKIEGIDRQNESAEFYD